MELALFLFALLAQAAPPSSAPSPFMRLQLSRGVVRFDAETNVSALRIHGEGTRVTGSTKIERTSALLLLHQLEAWIPVEDLKTGMASRDRHMRERVFLAADGTLPALRFTAERVSCPREKNGYVCSVAGRLTLRGVTRDVVSVLRINPEQVPWKIEGSFPVKLTEFGIERPKQLGVQVEDSVRVQLEFGAELLSDKSES